VYRETSGWFGKLEKKLGLIHSELELPSHLGRG